MKGANVTNISFVRGYGIIEDYFCLIFENSTIKYKFEIEFDNSLEKDDKVTLIRMDGGQQYYLFERVDKDGYGF